MLGSVEPLDNPTTEEGIFVKLANSLYEPAINTTGIVSLKQRDEHKYLGACFEAEPMFSSLYNGQIGEEADDELGTVLVFDDKEGKPVLVQKTRGVGSALGLSEIDMEGVHYPAGTLYSLYSTRSRELHRLHRRQGKPLGPLRTEHHTLNTIDSIAPVRLSLLALPPAERILHSHLTSGSYPLGQAAVAQCRELGLEDFGNAFQLDTTLHSNAVRQVA
jgi:hypothetical protein